jgi:CRP/FNR family transcriptional regulator, transcriptional activator FtrB
MRPHELPEIRNLPLFREMQQGSFESLMQGAYSQAFPVGLDLARQGDPADFLHVVLEGSVELFGSWGGRESTMAVVRPVGTFILAACIKDAPYLMSARTLVRSRIVLVPASDLRAIFRRDPDFAVPVIHELAAAYRSVVRQAKGLKLRSSRERIAAYLLENARLARNARSYTLPVEKRLLASYLGMTPENFSRALKTLEADGVKTDGTRVVITDHAKLTAVAKPDYLIDGPDPEASATGAGIPFWPDET